MLFNEPKLLKFDSSVRFPATVNRFSALQRAEIAEIESDPASARVAAAVSVLFNEPKLLKSTTRTVCQYPTFSFSALQRAEIAEMHLAEDAPFDRHGFSALQRAEIAEILSQLRITSTYCSFSALQRAEIAEIEQSARRADGSNIVSVLFNEPKLLKCRCDFPHRRPARVSVLFNEPKLLKCPTHIR